MRQTEGGRSYPSFVLVLESDAPGQAGDCNANGLLNLSLLLLLLLGSSCVFPRLLRQQPSLAIFLAAAANMGLQDQQQQMVPHERSVSPSACVVKTKGLGTFLYGIRDGRTNGDIGRETCVSSQPHRFA